MRKLYAAIIFILISFSGIAQNVGNEWITFGGTGKYFTFKIYRTGIHRIDYNTLLNAGVPVASLNPKNFQIFGREQEQYIYVFGEQDNSFDPGDYIEFYAEANDGKFDSLLYANGVSDMPDTYYSLYNDTITYYFTWNNIITNRRVLSETDTAFSTYTPLNWFWTTNHIKSVSRYLQGPLFSGASLSDFFPGECWASDFYDGLNNGYLDSDVNTSQVYQGTGAPDAFVQTSVIGGSNAGYTGTGNHHTKIFAGNSLSLLYDTIYVGYQLHKYNFTLPNAELGTGTTKIRHQGINDQGAGSDFQSVGSTTVTYPHTTDLSGANQFSFTVPYNNSEPKSRFDLQNPGSGNFVLYDLTDTLKRISYVTNGGNYTALIPNHNNGSDADCYLSSVASIYNVSALSPVNGTGDFTDYVAMNIDHAYIIITHPTLLAEANQYAAYRSSIPGGGYNTVVVNVEELYHQYGAGIEKHALGIRRFLNDVYQHWPTHPSFLFLIGKSIRESTESTNGNYPGTRKDTTAFRHSLVPSYGYPCSDAMFSSGFDTTFLEVAIPTGRLSAQTGSEVTDYLNKMQQFEALQDSNSVYTIADKDWMKHIMHFGGGSSTTEQQDIQTYLLQYEHIIEGLNFGGDVHTYLKQSSDPINPVEYAEVMDRINNGVSMITFMGHSSINGFDQNIDEPANWANTGKYPFLLANACYSGDIHQPDAVSASEEFVKQQNKGTIGFLSTTKQGFLFMLHTYSNEFYHQLSVSSYGEPVGVIMQRTVNMVQPADLTFIPTAATCEQMTLHGDPALRINYHVKPEFAIRQQDVFYEPSTITLANDSVNVNFIVTNIGKATADTVSLELHRQFPNGADSLYRKQLFGLYYKDTVTFRLPVEFNIGTGLNIMDFFVDIPSFTPEVYDELYNNEVTSSMFVYSNGIAPVYPYEYAIIPDSVINFKASTYNPLIGLRNYRFEIDTTIDFNSSEHRYQSVTAAGGVVQASTLDWLSYNTSSPSPLIFSDSTVYYWRVSPDSTIYSWHESSFQYIKGLTGWGQAHFDQFGDNYYEVMDYDKPDYGWKWNPNIRRVGCVVYGNAVTPDAYNGTLWTIDGVQQDYGGCLVDPGIHVAVIDPLTLAPWGTYGCDPLQGGSCPSTCVMVNADHQFGNLNDGCACRGRVEYYFNFRQDTPQEMDSLISLINNHIPDEYYILIYTWRFADYSYWTPQLYSMMNALGADSIYPGRQDEPWIFLTKKGDPSYAKIMIGDSINQVITFSDTLYGYDYVGSMVSPQVGPASAWQSLYWQQHPIDGNPTDTARIYLYGIDQGGNEHLLIDTVFTYNDSILNLQGIVDAAVYPKVKLKAWCKDTTYFNPPFFDRWQLVYTPAPEAAVNGEAGFYFSALSDSLEDGQNFKVAIAVQNISDYPMDSLLVHYWIEDRNRQRNYLAYPRQDSLLPGEILLDTVTFNCTGYSGINSLWMEVNPVPLNSPNSNYDQIEEYHFNNFAQIPFYVNADITNPVLDVTFDGIHILNGDIVSGKPFVLITLKDENPYLIMDQESDTSFFAVYLTDPAGNQKRLYFRNGLQQNMIWYPSSGPQGKFKIEMNPALALDGKYTLLIQASDKSGNKSGDVDYKIQFEVDNKPSVTEVLNYPNPFSTKTHFVFTLTGNQLPDFFKIQIMTITGKVVREITMEEMGNIHIGRNVTDYYWDGTDMFGDQLANGIYLYRVVARLNGQDMDKRESGADQYITKGLGKMYLMR